jgi:HEAT repeat protein
MAKTKQIPLQQLIDTLLDEQEPLPSRYVYRLSDLSRDDLKLIATNWANIPLPKRQTLMEDVERLSSDNTLLSFESLSRLALEDSDPRVRELGIRSLWEYEHHDLAGLFLSFLEGDESADVRAAAADALGRFVYLGELDELPNNLINQIEASLLAKMSSDDATHVRRRSLESLGFSGRDEVHPLIEAAYFSGNDDWLISALTAMGRSANERWSKHVGDMLDHDRTDVRIEAARSSGELEAREHLERLVELLDDPDQEVRMAAIWSLSQIGGEGVREALEQLYDETEDEDELDHIEAALDNLDFTEGIELFSILDVPDVDDDDLDELDDDDDYEFDLDEDEDLFEEDEDDAI